MDISQFYQFRSSLGTSVIVRRGDGAPTQTGGGARWKTVTRPRRVSLVQWDGLDPYTMDVPVLFDGWSDENDVEADIAILNQMHSANNVADLTPPPTVYIEGAVPIKGAKWIVSDISWGQVVIYHAIGDKGFRYRQDAIVHLMQFIASDPLIFRKPSSSSILHIVKKGETLKTIAKDHTGDANNAKDIQKANGIRDPKSVKPGDTVKVPKSSRVSTSSKPPSNSPSNIEKALRRPFLR